MSGGAAVVPESGSSTGVSGAVRITGASQKECESSKAGGERDNASCTQTGCQEKPHFNGATDFGVNVRKADQHAAA